MAILVPLLMGAFLLFLLGKVLTLGSAGLSRLDAILFWLWENRVLLSFLTMGVMLVPWLFIWIDGAERRNALRPMSAKVKDEEERRLWKLAEKKANREIAEWERRTGKKKTPAGRRETTGRFFEEMKHERLE